MEYRTLGKTSMKVSRIGYGGARIGSEQVAPDRVEAALNTALDLGINFVDTAACYHDSEALIGTLIGRRPGPDRRSLRASTDPSGASRRTTSICFSSTAARKRCF